MKHRSILSGQAVHREKALDLSWLWRGMSRVGSFFLKFSTLVITFVVISLLFVCAYDYVLTSPYIRLEEVVVAGVEGDLKAELLETANLDFKLSLLAINLNDLKQRLEKHPWVRTVDIEKRFPHTLVIRAEKEEPRGVVLMDKLYYMNRWGEVFKEVDEIDELDYPLITGIPQEEEERGRHLQQALHVLKTLESEKSPWSLKELSEVHLRKDGYVSLYFSSVPGVVKLRGMELDQRMADLKKVVEHLNTTGRIHMVRGINLDYHDGAVVSFKKG